MEDRGFTEVDLREMVERAVGFRPDVVDGRFVIEGLVSRQKMGSGCRARRNGASSRCRHGVRCRAMKQRYLEVTFRKGKPLAAYLYLPRARGARVARTVDEGRGIHVELDDTGAPMGVEITAPGAVTVAELNAILMKHGVAALADEEWAHLAA